MPPSGWPATSYLTQVRTAIRDWLTIEAAGDQDDIILNIIGGTSAVIAGMSLDSATAAGRRFRITACNQAANVGTYTLVSGSGTGIVWTPALPELSGITTLTFSLETAVARYFKSMIWYDEKGKLPANVLNECPLLVMSGDGQYTNDARFSQVNALEAPYHFQICGSGRDQENAEYAHGLVRDRLFRGRDGRHNFGMPTDVGYRSGVIGAPTFTLRDNADGQSTASGLFWLCEFVLFINVARPVNLSA